MKAILIEPHAAPIELEIENNGGSFREYLGGPVERFCPFDDKVVLYRSVYGKMLNMPFNRAIRNEQGDIIELIAGSFLILGVDDQSNLVGLSDSLASKYLEIFREPEKPKSIPLNVFFGFMGKYVGQYYDNMKSSNNKHQAAQQWMSILWACRKWKTSLQAVKKNTVGCEVIKT